MNKTTDVTTEEKIIEAARKVFTQKGFECTKLRDIAAEANINLSSVNYYFRSKEKLFENIMTDTVLKIFNQLSPYINDQETSYFEPLFGKVKKPLFYKNL